MTSSLEAISTALQRRRVRPSLPRLSPRAVSWLQVGALAFVLVVLFALPTFLFLVVSFFDYDRTGIYPAFILDNYRDLLTTPATIRVYLSSLKFAVIVWAITLLLGFNIAYFLIFHIRSAAVRTVLFLLCAIPFWTSGIIRAIAWIPFLGRNGAYDRPAGLERGHRLQGASGAGLDPCAALQTSFQLAAGQRLEVRILLGEASDRAAALDLIRRGRGLDDSGEGA